MYRLKEDYNRMAELAIDILIDYGVDSFPLDTKLLCKKMGFNLIPYSSFDKEIQLLCKKCSNDGFCLFGIKGRKPAIYYNDLALSGLSRSRIQSTICHEIKHILCKDMNDYKDDLADYFSKYLRCPIPLLIFQNVTDINYIISNFEISYEQASYIIENLINRRKTYGNQIFDNEKPLLESILKEKYITNTK